MTGFPRDGFALLIAGHCVQLERFVRRGGAWRPIEFPSAVAVIPHPDGGVALFDTGYAPRFHTATAALPYRLYAALLPVTCDASDAVVTQLRQRGVAPEQVRLIVLSHLHGDHVAGLRDFPEARVVVGDGALASGWRTRSAWVNTRHGFVPALLPDDIEDRLLPLAGLAVGGTGLGGRLRNGYDLFGDGAAFVLPLPGHTDGHLGLWLPRVGADGVLLVGDAVWNERAFTHGELPPPPLRGDRPRCEEVVGELTRLHADRPELAIVPSHCVASLDRVGGRG
ncbi:MAG: MBL fold metallo-hydrolase [Micropruina sp.]|uniref:MBL fold metallo-hydrolase n=1 Tax=Micropruina sp. TaxID=2737536 RepID=UPI0039E43143